MSFIQILEMRTKNIDEIKALYEPWERATRGRRTLRRSLLTRDRNDPHQCGSSGSSTPTNPRWRTRTSPRPPRSPTRQPRWPTIPSPFHDLEVLDDRSPGAHQH